MKSLSVLVVEDSVVQRTMLADMCRELGASTVAEAENGRVAMALIDAQDHEFDMLICDLEMPDVNGIELIDLLAARNTSSGLVILSSREESLIYAVGLMASKKGLRVLGNIRKPIHLDQISSLFSACDNRDQTVKRSFQPLQQLSAVQISALLKQQRVVLHYQPKLSLEDMSQHGVEALVRLQDDNGKIIFPDQFIGVCEREGLIDDLSFEIVRQAVEQKKRWTDQGLITKVSINLSAISFQNSVFCDSVLKIINDMGADAQNVIFEVTESAVIQDISLALTVLTKLRLAGCGLSLDDYGTGYAAVKQLAQIPFTELKMDRSLIDGIASKGHLQVIFESTLKMCRELGIELVAEGIEQRSDLAFLQHSTCPVGQGYLFSPPIAEDDFIHWFRAGMPTLNNG